MKQTGQAIKFLIPLIAIIALNWWLDTCDIRPYADSTQQPGQLCEKTWLPVSLFTVSGASHVLFYLLIASRRLCTSLSYPSILVLALITSSVSTASMLEWRVLEYVMNPQWWIWLVYYPLLSVASISGRYYWLRRSDQLGAIQTAGSASHPTDPANQCDRANR